MVVGMLLGSVINLLHADHYSFILAQGSPPWCPTKVDENGVLVPSTTGYCGADCVVHEDVPLLWKKPKDFEMNLLYEDKTSTAIMNGIKFWVFLISCLTLYILTWCLTLIATSKITSWTLTVTSP